MSKIAEVRASAHSRPFSAGFVRLGLGVNTKRNCVVVRVIDADGYVGWSEAHHRQNPTPMAEIVQRRLGSLLKGADVLDSKGIWARLARQQIVTPGFGAGSSIARSGIDIALWGPQGQDHGAAGLPPARRRADSRCHLSDLSSALVFEAGVGGINPFGTELAGTAHQVADVYIAPPDKPSLAIDPSVPGRHPAMPGRG